VHLGEPTRYSNQNLRSAFMRQGVDYYKATYFRGMGSICRSHPIFKRRVGHRDTAKHVSLD